MTAMIIDDRKGITADWARNQWHMIPIADIELIARNTRGEGNELLQFLQATRLPLQIFPAGTAATIAEVNSVSPARTQLIALRRKSRRRVWVE